MYSNKIDAVAQMENVENTRFLLLNVKS